MICQSWERVRVPTTLRAVAEGNAGGSHRREVEQYAAGGQVVWAPQGRGAVLPIGNMP